MSEDPVMTTRKRIIEVREFAIDRRKYASLAIKLAQEAERQGKAERAKYFRKEAEVVDAVANGVEGALSLLFD